MRVQIVFLLVALLLLSSTTALAQGQTKVPVCHMDEDGNLILISIADPAYDAHIAHGDPEIGVDVDDNCELLPLYKCYDVTPTYYSDKWYVLLGDSGLQAVGRHTIYSDPDCTISSGTIAIDNFWYIWASDSVAAESYCNDLTEGFGEIHFETTPTSHLFKCYGYP